MLLKPKLDQNWRSGPELAKVYNTLSEATHLFLNDNNAEYLSVAMKKNDIQNTTLNNLFVYCLTKGSSVEGNKRYIHLFDWEAGLPSGSLLWDGSEGGYHGTGEGYYFGNGPKFIIEDPDCTLSAVDSKCGIIVYTSNSRARKIAENRLVTGLDVFKMYIANNGEVYLDGQVPGEIWWGSSGCTEAGMAAGTDPGKGCAGRIAARGWRVDY